MTEEKFLGQIPTAGGLKSDELKETAIRNVQTPKNVAEIQQSLGCVNYLARLLPKVFNTAKPLWDLTCKTISGNELTKNESHLMKRNNY